jgi:hypothetical protein
MPKMMANNHIGKMVLFLYPIPNGRILPSGLYKNDGFHNKMVTYTTINKKMDTSTGLFLIK